MTAAGPGAAEINSRPRAIKQREKSGLAYWAKISSLRRSPPHARMPNGTAAT
jgi:hypothetical protein